MATGRAVREAQAGSRLDPRSSVDRAPSPEALGALPPLSPWTSGQAAAPASDRPLDAAAEIPNSPAALPSGAHGSFLDRARARVESELSRQEGWREGMVGVARARSTKAKRASVVQWEREREAAVAERRASLARQSARLGSNGGAGPSPGPDAPPPLPEGWTEARDENTGALYYYHVATGQTTWDRPRPSGAAERPLWRRDRTTDRSVAAAYAKVREKEAAAAKEDADKAAREDSGCGERSLLKLGVPRIHAAAMSGNVDGLKLMLTRLGYDVDAVEPEHGATALMLACVAGRMGVIRLLLSCSASCSKADHYGCTALQYALSSGNEAAVRALIDHGDKAVLAEANAIGALDALKKEDSKTGK
jgi:hypothetical protein